MKLIDEVLEFVNLRSAFVVRLFREYVAEPGYVLVDAEDVVAGVAQGFEGGLHLAAADTDGVFRGAVTVGVDETYSFVAGKLDVEGGTAVGPVVMRIEGAVGGVLEERIADLLDDLGTDLGGNGVGVLGDVEFDFHGGLFRD